MGRIERSVLRGYSVRRACSRHVTFVAAPGRAGIAAAQAWEALGTDGKHIGGSSAADMDGPSGRRLTAQPAAFERAPLTQEAAAGSPPRQAERRHHARRK